MYQLETSTGLRLAATTVETVVSALTRQLDSHPNDHAFAWSVTTPHGTVVSDDNTIAGRDPADGSAVAAARVDHAYGLLVRDHLIHARSAVHTGLLRTS